MKKKFNPLQAIKELPRNSGLPPSARATLMVLAAHADETGKCFPTVKTIAEITGLTERGVYKALRKLREIKVIKIYRFRRNNVYKINSDWQLDEAPEVKETPELSSGIKDKEERQIPELSSGETLNSVHPKIQPKSQISIVAKNELNSTEQASDAVIRKEKEKSKDLGEDQTQKPMTVPQPPSNEAAEFKGKEKSMKDLEDSTQEPMTDFRSSEDKAAGLEDVGENVQESLVMPNSPLKGRQNQNAVEPKPEVNVAETGESVNPEKEGVVVDQKNANQTPLPWWRKERKSKVEKLLETPPEQLKREPTPEEKEYYQRKIKAWKAMADKRKKNKLNDKPPEEQSQHKESQVTYNNPPSEQSKQVKHTQQPAKAANNTASPNAQRALAKAKTYGDVIDIITSEIAGAMRVQTMKTPTWEQWWVECLRRCVPENIARQAYQYYESNHWRDSKGRPIHNWRAIVNGLSRRQLEERARRTEIKLRKEEAIHG